MTVDTKKQEYGLWVTGHCVLGWPSGKDGEGRCRRIGWRVT
jgi:hypothetical protein